MLRIAGQTTGPIGLKFFVDTHGWPGVLWPVKMEFFSKIFFSNFVSAGNAGTFS